MASNSRMSARSISPRATSRVLSRSLPEVVEALTSEVPSAVHRVRLPVSISFVLLFNRSRRSRLYCIRANWEASDAAASTPLSGAQSSAKNTASLAAHSSSRTELNVEPFPDIDAVGLCRSHLVPKWCMASAAAALL